MADLMEAHLTTLILMVPQCPHIILKHHQGQLTELLELEAPHILHIFPNQPQIIIAQQVQGRITRLTLNPILPRRNSYPQKDKQ